MRVGDRVQRRKKPRSIGRVAKTYGGPERPEAYVEWPNGNAGWWFQDALIVVSKVGAEDRAGGEDR